MFEIELPAEAFPKLTYNPVHFKSARQVVFAIAKDRFMPDGRKALYVDQLQSDWGQRGRKQGFTEPVLREDVDYSVRQIRDIIKGLRGLFQQRLDELAEGINVTKASDQFLERTVKRRQQQLDEFEKNIEETVKQLYKRGFPLKEGNLNIETINKAGSELERLTGFSEYNVPVPKEVATESILPELDDSSEPVIVSFRNLSTAKLNAFKGFGQYPNAPFITQTQHWSKLMVKRLLKKHQTKGMVM